VRSPQNGSIPYSSEASAHEQWRVFALLNRPLILSLQKVFTISDDKECLLSKHGGIFGPLFV
jgi:hypothetical protein